jgi:hypothetical protein
LKSLYGHPLAGKLWQGVLAERLQRLSGVESELYKSNWIFRRKDQPVLLNIYVDDLTLAARHDLHHGIWYELRDIVKLDPEIYVTREGSVILGRTHRLVRDAQESTMYYDMRSYAKQILSFYCDLCGVSEEYLKPVPSPALPESSMQDEEAEKQGELHRGAAKASMRLLWLSRLSRPDLSFIIGRLAASNVSRWSKWDDRQLH